MSYINQKQKDKLEEDILNLTGTLVTLILNDPKDFASILNHTFYKITCGVVLATGGLSYVKIAAVTGVLKNVSDQFYRKLVVNFEDSQKELL